jgi:hypothetical protein
MFVLPLHVYSRQSSSLSLCQIELNGTHVTNDCQGHSWPWLTMDKFPASACCCHVSMYLSSHDTFRLGSSRLISRRGKGRPGREHLSLSLSLSLSSLSLAGCCSHNTRERCTIGCTAVRIEEETCAKFVYIYVLQCWKRKRERERERLGEGS